MASGPGIRHRISSPAIHCSSSFTSTSFLPPTPTRDVQDMRPESNAPAAAVDAKKPCDISNLMSPPEQVPYESFRHFELGTKSQRQGSVIEVRRQAPLSPPFSPPRSSWAVAGGPPPPTSTGLQDPILFPLADNAGSPPAGPLFNQTEEASAAARQLVDEHIASRSSSLFREATPPRREDYELALYFKSSCLKMFTENRKAYFLKERELRQADRKNMAMARPMVKLPPILPASRPALPKPQIPRSTVARIQKPKSPTKMKAPGPRPIRATPTTVRQTIRVSATPEPRVRTVAPNREDKDFLALEDYCPPLSSLPNKANSLKVDWKGNALDLSKDPHAHLLHPDELSLAAGLRLDCATYLTSKRRIFIRRLECAKQFPPKEFRKTDAQQACKIDVNKASKLWVAYDKVGWLDSKWIQKYLNN
ncbi:SWIRM domain-containing protein FUN19 [Podospora aff. communis PSN243]|uniref:SWIRM domain-containing protein FUN19 n=1 Tax=Podospora aff. communis PSN243 TaxID=3040156 RepID=A0AAV9G560_9PEZI|nr:SWIRM domain-containing protein FUN19 [Podospora aff. communis PSN243]